MPCKLCGAHGTNSTNCPKNPSARKPNYQAHGGGYNDDACPICQSPFRWAGNPTTATLSPSQLAELSDLSDTTKVIELSCQHVYHIDCLRRALISNPTCPMCRTDITTEDRRKITGHHRGAPLQEPAAAPLRPRDRATQVRDEDLEITARSISQYLVMARERLARLQREQIQERGQLWAPQPGRQQELERTHARILALQFERDQINARIAARR